MQSVLTVIPGKNLMNWLIRFSNWLSLLRKNLKFFHKIPHRVRNPKKMQQCAILSLDEGELTQIMQSALTDILGKNLMNWLIRFSNQLRRLRTNLKIFQNIPHRVMNLKKSNGVQFRVPMSEN